MKNTLPIFTTYGIQYLLLMAYLPVSQNTFGTSTPDRLFYFWNLRSLFLIDNLKIVDLGCLDFKFGLLAETLITTC
jgi:hypothetical protein